MADSRHQQRQGGSGVTACSALVLARLIAGGELSAGEVVDAHLKRVEQVNPSLNAVVALASDAREGARQADQLLADGVGLGKLHGVPFTVKDNIETAGVVTAAGSRKRAGVVPSRDATVVARLRAAGAILLGKTNCPEWGSGLETSNALYGRTNNPYDLTRTPGGTSGGEAAIMPGSANTPSLAAWWPVGSPAAGITVAVTASSPARAGHRTGSGSCFWI